jgi:predicted RecB family nuclease
MFSPSAIADFLACQHLTELNRELRDGEIEKPHYYPDLGLALLRKLGLEHEQKFLGRLQEEGKNVVAIPDDLSRSEGARRTVEAMKAGADVIYQASFLTSEWYGRADFLLKVEKQSALGVWSYEVVETKLARSTKARAIVQLCFYSDLVAEIQGVLPDRMHVVLGGKTPQETFSVQRYLAYFRKIKSEFVAATQQPSKTYPELVEHCRLCDWSEVCDQLWHQDDHLSLVANITRHQRKALVERGVTSMAQLATLQLPMMPKIEGIAPVPLLRIREQARVQVRGRTENRPVVELITEVKEAAQKPGEAETLRGLAALPLPSKGDLFLDFEGDPFAFEQGLEYLIGMVTIGEGGTPQYAPIWSFDPTEEKQSFIEFIGLVRGRRQQYPDMHIYHYAPYEPTAIKHLSGRHGLCQDEVDELLRAEVFVDLYRVVRQGIRASVESYSIKKMEPFYGFTRTVPLRNATASLQAFETVLALGEDPQAAQEILQTIADYNRDDCVSTLEMRTWLETLRTELESMLGATIPRPELKSGAPNEDLKEQLSEIAFLKEQLVADLAEERDLWTNEQRACWLLAQLLEWHRREEKSMWWEYYRLCDLSDEELIEDKNALGGLEYVGVVGEKAKSFIHRYKFPFQDYTIDRALDVHDPRTQDSVGTIDDIDELNLTIDIKRGKTSEKPHPTALIPHDYVSSKKQVESLMRIARWVIENGISGPGKFEAATDTLLRRIPRLKEGSIQNVSDGVSSLEAAKRLALLLDSSVLPIQGPPGSGKTFTGAHMIIELVKAGKRVGITAGSHKVISNLLEKICGEADETVNLRIVQKPNEDDGYEHDLVEPVKTNERVREKLDNSEANIAAGTVWLWAREEMADSVDVLFVDEAGQMSLANVLAVSPAAQSVVLLGDPQQLDQPQKGVHPPGAEVSALAHLLNGKATIESDQGLFLSDSWRLPPDICSYTSEVFYDRRLSAIPENRFQRLNSTGALDGTGLRFAPVIHSGNQSDAPEEVARIAILVEELLATRASWTNNKEETEPLELKDILIVAPYNAQVALLKQRLPKARVGTVDKFQGQQAPVVLYSMTSSTQEDAPRGMEFLYSSNRLNVATSRAQCVTVLVASPALFDVSCKTPRQMELANAFCRYLEMAEVI